MTRGKKVTWKNVYRNAGIYFAVENTNNTNNNICNKNMRGLKHGNGIRVREKSDSSHNILSLIFF